MKQLQLLRIDMKSVIIIAITVVCSVVTVLGITMIIKSVEKENPLTSLLFVQMAHLEHLLK